MRVGIVTHHLDEASGVGTYARELVAALPGAGVEPVVFSARPPAPGGPAKGLRIVSGRAGGRIAQVLWAMYGAPRAARRLGIELLHYVWPLGPGLGGPPFVTTIHDALNFALPEYRVSRPAEALLRRSARRARLVLTPSDAAAAEVGRHYGLPAEDIAVTPLGAPDVEPRDPGSRGEWWLFLGGIEKRKNLRAALAAWHGLREPRAPLEVVGTLEPSPRHDDLDELRSLAGRGVKLRGNVSHPELERLYRGAIALVSPSLGEGFGLPVLEAMAYGVPVIASDVSATPEVSGNAALLVEPEAEAIAVGMRRIDDTPELRASLRQRGLERAAELRWSHTAARTAAAYDRALARPPR